MKIVIAPDSYKESLSALEVAVQIEAGFRTQFPDAEYIKLPVAGCRLPVAGCRLPVAGCRLPMVARAR